LARPINRKEAQAQHPNTIQAGVDVPH
jgi:hypothetical protein